MNDLSHKGTYILVLQLDKAAKLTVGKLGVFDFPAGSYCYVGSAFGAGGVGGRLKHHLSPVKKAHWHIDHLREVAVVRAVWGILSERVYEHDWAAALMAHPGASVPAPRFGASDCRCLAHLIHFAERPDVSVLHVSISELLKICL